jgi:carboxyl-terminal processing protease
MTQMMRIKYFYPILIVLIVLLGCTGSLAYTELDTPDSVEPLQPSSEYSRLDKTIANLLDYYHYRRDGLDDERSAAVLDSYLESLDFNRSYFLASDIEHFERYRYLLDDFLQAGILEPAYEIFNVYQERLAERTARLKVQLERDISFEVDETLALDGVEQPWAETRLELDERWRKRIKHEMLQLMLAGQEQDEAKQTLLRRYEGRLRRTAQQQSEDVFQLYMNAVAASYDPHTAYFSPRATENFNIQMSLSLEGIGTVLRMEEEQIKVVELVPGGPASLSGQLHPDDVIIGVGQGEQGSITDVIGWRLDDVVDMIRGRRGTVVRLEVQPAGAATGITRTVRLVRDQIKLEKQAASSEVRTIPQGDRELRIGVITIPTFYSDFAAAQRGDRDYRSTTRDVRRLLIELEEQQVDGVVVDLRQNGGGSLQEAIELTGLFIPGGPIVQVRNVRGQVDIEQDPDPGQVYAGPLAVLVNRFSASASEIFAGAIQDYGRGLVLGTPTFGKGTVQTLVDLERFLPGSENPLGQLKLTIAKFYRISGGSTQHRGVEPDIAFPSAVDSQEVGESAQNFALPWDEIRAIDYSRNPALEGLLPEIRQRHQRRLDGDPAFQVLLEEIESSKQARQRAEVSLMLSRRQAEHHQAESERLALRNRWRAIQGLPAIDPDELAEVDGDTAERPDPLLDESARIVADIAALLAEKRGTLVMSN